MARGTASSTRMLSPRPPSPRLSIVSAPPLIASPPSTIIRSISAAPSPMTLTITASASETLSSVSSIPQTISSPTRFSKRRPNGKRLPQAPVFIGRPKAPAQFPFPSISIASSDDEDNNDSDDLISMDYLNSSPDLQTKHAKNKPHQARKQLRFPSTSSNTDSNPDRYCFMEECEDDNMSTPRRCGVVDPLVGFSSPTSSIPSAPIPPPIIVRAELPSSPERVWQFDDDFPSIAASESTACGELPRVIKTRTKSFGTKNHNGARRPSGNRARQWNGSENSTYDFVRDRVKRSSATDRSRTERLSFAESIKRSFGFSKTYRQEERTPNTPNIRESMGCTGLFSVKSKRRETIGATPRRNLRRYRQKKSETSETTESRLSIRGDDRSAWDAKTAEELLRNSMLAYDDFMHSPSKPSPAARVFARFRRASIVH